MKLRAAFGAVCLLFSGTSIAENALKTFQPLDVFELEYANDPQFSPQTDSIIYVRNFMDIMTDKRRSDLWQVSEDGKTHRPLTTDRLNAWQPRLSPDGKRLAYMSNRDGAGQLYVRWLDTGKEMQLATLTKGASNISWSPDGKWIAFTQFVAEPAKPYAKMPPKPRGAQWNAPAKVEDRAIFRFDGVGELPNGHSQIFIVPSEGGTIQQLTKSSYDHRSSLSWTADSTSILYSANMNAFSIKAMQNSEVYKISVKDKEEKALTNRYGPDFSPIVSPNGKWIAYLGYDDKSLGHSQAEIYLMKIDGSASRLLTGDFDRNVVRIQWGSKSKNVYFLYDGKGDSHIAKVDVKGKVKTLVSRVGGDVFGRPYAGGDFDIAKDGRIAYTINSTEDLANIAIASKSGKNTKQLTHINDDLLDFRAMGTVEEIWYESSFDKQKIHGWIAKPANFDPNKKYPLVLEIHGGPFTNYGFRFSPEVQMFTAAGYVVLYTNPRGSTSYGSDFANLIHHNYPSNDYDDLMSGVDEVIAKGYIDESRLYVTGGSGGGVLTSWIVGKTDRFAAAVVAKPVINWGSFALYADIAAYVSKNWFGKMPWEDPMYYWNRSPISLVGNVKTPTMLLTGESDLRTPMPETIQYYQALKMRGIDTKLVRIPGAYHGITKRPSNLISKITHIIQWFEDHKGEAK